MLDDAAEVAAALSGTVLAGRPLAVASLDSDTEVAFVVPCGSGEVLAAWTAAREALERTRRWPVVITEREGSFEDLSAVYGFDQASPEAVSAGAEAVDPDDALAARAARDDAKRWQDRDGQDASIRYELERTARSHGSAPSISDVKAALGDDPGDLTLDRWLFDWELAAEAEGASPATPERGHLTWYVPGEPCAVALLPTPNGWQVPAWLPFWGAQCEGGHELLIAVMRTWHERWGAEIVAHWGTMLGLLVRRPPTSAADAYPLALAHDLMAGSTLPARGVAIREHARALVDQPAWFLHDKP